MAACSIGGALSVKSLNIDIRKARCTAPEIQNVAKFCQLKEYGGRRGVQIRHHPVLFAGSSRKAWRCSKPLILACESTSQVDNSSKDCSEEKKSGHSAIHFAPDSSEVHSLLTNICDTTSIAEFKLDFGGFRLHVKRGLEEKSIAPPLLPPSPPASHTDTSNPNPVLNGSPSTSLAILKPKPSLTGIKSFLDAATDEGLVILQSPKVGLFRRSRTIKGKRAPPSCQEKQEVKEGQVICYIEQLGGEIPIESDASGEVMKILREDGEPVGYNDALIAILPSFPGIKKLQQ